MSFPASLPSPPPERSSSISDVEAILNYKFKNPKLLEEALTHPSVQYTPNYERLEFLGDRVVNLVVGDQLFQAYPGLNEGELTDLMKANVSNENLARVALRRGLYPFLRHKMPNSDDQVSEFARAVEEEDGGSVKAPDFLADIVESVAAAIYYDVGSNLKRFWKIFKGLLGPIVGPESVNHGFDGPLEIEKAKLELDKLCVQKKWHKPNYEAVVSDPQQYVCTVEIVTGDGVPYSVKGEKRSSKKKAEQCAAYRMLLVLNDQAQKRQRGEEMFSPTSLPSLSPERGPSVSQVEAILRYKFEDPKLLEEALTHSSILDAPSYERLEFVGDRVLNLAVSDHLVQAYPELDQGQLSTLLSANVCKEKLAQVALRCKLYKFLSHKMQYSNGQAS
ncbi:hypothetical protein ACJRO7_022898 [Eucalyptus globulus]|uniref:RNase III domain-containing protein n=1 Tax=Eucalyptus globulus TaxID=34317 RepID=A0ABD3K5V8_EUCGL